MRQHHDWHERHERIKKNKERVGTRLPLMKRMATRRRSILSREQKLGEDVAEDFAAALSHKSPLLFVKDTSVQPQEELNEDAPEEDELEQTLRTANGGPVQQAMVCGVISPKVDQVKAEFALIQLGTEHHIVSKMTCLRLWRLALRQLFIGRA